MWHPVFCIFNGIFQHTLFNVNYTALISGCWVIDSVLCLIYVWFLFWNLIKKKRLLPVKAYGSWFCWVPNLQNYLALARGLIWEIITASTDPYTLKSNGVFTESSHPHPPLTLFRSWVGEVVEETVLRPCLLTCSNKYAFLSQQDQCDRVLWQPSLMTRECPLLCSDILGGGTDARHVKGGGPFCLWQLSLQINYCQRVLQNTAGYSRTPRSPLLLLLALSEPFSHSLSLHHPPPLLERNKTPCPFSGL